MSQVDCWVRETEWRPLRDLVGHDLSNDDEGWWAREARAKAERLRHDLKLRYVPLSLETRNGALHFRAMGVAGSLLLRGHTIQIAPKFVGPKNLAAGWQETILTMLARARRRIFTYSPVRRIGFRRLSFVDHMALAYADALERALRQEAIHAYRTQEENAPCLRGRFAVERQIQAPLDRPHRIHCKVDYLDTDNQFNHLLHWAGRRFLALVFDGHVRRRLSVILGQLPAVSEPLRLATHLPLLAPPQYDRFSEALEIASMLARGYGHAREPGRYSGYGYVLNMERLFESFVEESVKHAVTFVDPNYVARAQVSQLYAKAIGHSGKSYYTRPDNVVYDADGKALLLLDAKYKRFAEADEGDISRPNNSDIYQLFASLASHQCDRGLLLYPRLLEDAQDGDGTVRYWELHGAGTRFLAGAATVDICGLTSKKDLAAFDQQLAELVRQVLTALS